MKKIFAVALLLNLNLYTVERIEKKLKKFRAEEYVKLIDMDEKEFYDIITNTTINDLKKNIKKRKKRTNQSDCLPCFDKYLSRMLTAAQNYLNE